MIPLVYFLFAWFAALAFFGIMSFLSVVQMVRFGDASMGTYVSTALFLMAGVVAVLAATSFFVHIDWTLSIDFSTFLRATPVFTP